MITQNDIILYTICYNESRILPFVVNYWKRICCKVILYDNYSTDSTLDIIKQQYSDFIEVRKFEYSNNQINDYELQQFKNHVWKEARNKYKYVIVCDVDELLYVNNVNDFFNKLDNQHATIVKPIGYDLICEVFPGYTPNILLHNLVNFGVRNSEYMDKCIMFNPNEIQEINYNFGSHKCNPIGNVNYFNGNVFLYHAKYLSLDYVINKFKSSSKKLSNFNINNNLGIEYLNKEDELKKTFYNKLNKAKYIADKFIIYKDDNLKNNIINSLNNYNNKLNPNINDKCIITICIYKTDLQYYEIISLKCIHEKLGKKYDICIICPEYIDLSKYENIIKNDFILRLSDICFHNIYTYNILCQLSNYYKIFNNYEYMLIYQLDAIIYKDNLEYFIDLGYDYYGGPHYLPTLKNGNGGLSLRKIEVMINLFNDIGVHDNIFEDEIISNSNINLAPIDIARHFSISSNPAVQVKELKDDIPFGRHYYLWGDFYNENIDYKYIYEK